MASENKCTTLKKDLGLVSALSLVVGMVLGAGAFMKPSSVLAVTGDTNTALWAWVVGGILSMAGGLTLCELGVLFPQTGGIFVYLEKVYNKKVSFLYGWVLTFIYGPATIGALVGYFSSVFCLLFNIPDAYTPLVGAGVLAFVVFVNAISVKRAGNLQTIATFCKLIPLILIVVFGMLWGNGKVFSQSTGALSMVGPFSAAILATLFAYDGWAQVASVAGEIKNPAKILPRAIIGGLCFLIVVYLGINIAMFKVLSASQIVAMGHDAAAVVSQKLFGLAGGNLVAVGIMVSILGGINGYIMTLSRVVLSMGERGQLPFSKVFGKLDCDSLTPVNGAALLAVFAFVYSRIFDADKLSDIAVFAIWIFYMLTFIAVIIARKKFASMVRTYKVPFYPVVPVIAIVGALYCLVGMIQASLMNAILAIVLTLVGLPVYAYLTRDGEKKFVPSMKTRTVVGILALVILGGIYVSTAVTDNRPVLRVAVAPTVNPYIYENKDGTKTGFEIELLNRIAAESGVKLQISGYEFATLFGVMDAKQADIAMGMMSVTKEREQRVKFSDSYYSGRIVLIAPASSPIHDLNGLTGQKVGVIDGTTGNNYVAKIPGVKLWTYSNSQDMLEAYIGGNLDAMVWDEPMFKGMQQANPQFKGEVKYTFDSEKYAIAVQKDDSRTLQRINTTLQAMEKSGELQKLREKWHLPQ